MFFTIVRLKIFWSYEVAGRIPEFLNTFWESPITHNRLKKLVWSRKAWSSCTLVNSNLSQFDLLWSIRSHLTATFSFSRLLLMLVRSFLLLFNLILLMYSPIYTCLLFSVIYINIFSLFIYFSFPCITYFWLKYWCWIPSIISSIPGSFSLSYKTLNRGPCLYGRH